jgi:hypothetical protein
MTYRTTVTAVLGAAAAATFIAGASTAGAPVTLASMSTPLTGYVHTAPPPPPRNCGPGYANGVIGGQPKCLREGQQCQQAHVPDYTRYGFDCAKAGNVFQLHRHNAPPPPPHKPGPPPPPHH